MAEAAASAAPNTPTPVRPVPASAGVRSRFARGRERPRGVVWFGASSFWGHLRHFLAAAIATEDVDSRDWMTPDTPEELLSNVVRELGGDASAASLVDALGRDVWVDFVADTGDDVSVSRAVARLLFAAYELPDPDRPGATLVAPRGEILLFGGDTAYPVATAQEITNRVVAPWNQVLSELPADPTPRVLLGIPGNHDWYDGLDGFQRLFRRRPADDEARASVVGMSQAMLQHYAEWAREFVRGGKVEKPRALVLAGYTPVQNASYFVLPVTRTLRLYAVDRQLRTPDSRQSRFLGDAYREQAEAGAWVLLPDPIFRFGRASKTGTAMIETLQLDLETRDHFVLTGDVHHYQRTRRGRLLHIIAGGGGAFLHPARLARGGLPHEVQWPNAAQSRRLLRGVAFKIGAGRSGFLPHLVLFALFFPAVSFGARFYEKLGVIVAAPLSMTIVLGIVYALIGGARRRPAVLPFAFVTSLLTALLPVAGSYVIRRAVETVGISASLTLIMLATLTVSVFAGVFVFGAYLALLTRLGFEHTQAFTALDHPGYKHFLRLRLRADGTGIDGYCLGLVDPLGERQEPVLVDTFSWRPGFFQPVALQKPQGREER
jgi:hypothetical protein